MTKISNNLPSNLRVVYLDVVPWYLRLYFHSVKISSIPKAAASGGSKKTDDPRSRLLRPLKVEFSPGRDRESPYVLEMVVELPANSVTEVNILLFQESYFTLDI